MKVSEPPIIVEETFNVKKEIVWQAITQPSQMRQWFFEQMEDFKAEVGFKTNFLVTNEGREFPHHWEIMEVVLNKKLVYNWKYPNYSGNSYVIFELEESENTTKLILTTRVTEDFPDEIPEFKRESCVGGWNYFIKDRLKSYLQH